MTDSLDPRPEHLKQRVWESIQRLGFGMLAFLPHQCFDMSTEGVWFRSQKGRQLVYVGAVTALIGAPLMVLLDEYYLDLPGTFPNLPAELLLMLIAHYGGVKRLFKASACETSECFCPFR